MQGIATSVLATAVQRAKAASHGSGLAAGPHVSPERPEVLSERIRHVLRGDMSAQTTGTL
jgi:hypothetical protein